MDKTTLTIDRETSDQISLIARAERCSKALVIRKALAAYAAIRDLNASAFDKPRMEVRA